VARQGQKGCNVLVVDLAGVFPVHQAPQAGRPEGAVRLHRVVERPNAREVAGQHNGFAVCVPKGQAPVPDQVSQTIGSPQFIGGQSQRGIAGIGFEDVAQSNHQVLAVVQPSVERDRAGFAQARLRFAANVEWRTGMCQNEARTCMAAGKRSGGISRPASNGRGVAIGHRPLVKVEDSSLIAHEK
jgi:hypothetical protein